MTSDSGLYTRRSGEYTDRLGCSNKEQRASRTCLSLDHAFRGSSKRPGPIERDLHGEALQSQSPFVCISGELCETKVMFPRVQWLAGPGIDGPRDGIRTPYQRLQSARVLRRPTLRSVQIRRSKCQEKCVLGGISDYTSLRGHGRDGRVREPRGGHGAQISAGTKAPSRRGRAGQAPARARGMPRRAARPT